MLYKYNGSVVDVLTDGEQTIILNPESEVEISPEFESHPYFARLIQLGSLRAVSPPIEPVSPAKSEDK
jgi:hypothetical protein